MTMDPNQLNSLWRELEEDKVLASLELQKAEAERLNMQRKIELHNIKSSQIKTKSQAELDSAKAEYLRAQARIVEANYRQKQAEFEKANKREKNAHLAMLIVNVIVLVCTFIFGIIIMTKY